MAMLLLCDKTGTWVSKSTICREGKNGWDLPEKKDEENSNSEE